MRSTSVPYIELGHLPEGCILPLLPALFNQAIVVLLVAVLLPNVLASGLRGKIEHFLRLPVLRIHDDAVLLAIRDLQRELRCLERSKIVEVVVGSPEIGSVERKRVVRQYLIAGLRLTAASVPGRTRVTKQLSPIICSR